MAPMLQEINSKGDKACSSTLWHGGRVGQQHLCKSVVIALVSCLSCCRKLIASLASWQQEELILPVPSLVMQHSMHSVHSNA